MERKEILIQIEAMESIITRITKRKDIAEKLGYYTDIDKNNLSITTQFVLDGEKITCYVKDPDGIIYAKGTARCHPDDEFDIENGMLLAELRAKQDIYRYLEKELLEIL